MIMPVLSQQLITTVGWRLAFTVIAALIALIAIPLIAAFLKERPEDLGTAPDGSSQQIAVQLGDTGMSWRAAHCSPVKVEVAPSFSTDTRIGGAR